MSRDPSSLSNPDEARVTHLSWDAVVDFDKRQLFANASYDVRLCSTTTPPSPPVPVPTLRLDTSGLDVQRVTVCGKPATFSMSVPDPDRPHLGSRLEIDLRGSGGVGVVGVGVGGGDVDNSDHDDSNDGGVVISVSIQYATSPNASAAQWLPPSQTAGKEHPYVFSACFAIHARSILPCQDCPSVKMTYDARVTVPRWATAVMSALSKENNDVESADGDDDRGDSDRMFEFSQPVPIPSYLFALAVGELGSIDVSPRCRVWSEPSMVEAAAYEFSQVEDFLSAAEQVTAVPYQWGRYDLLCLPPSFPYGGMENPCLTFVTPTLLAGDKSLADVVAHEAAHSWSGNLVTNHTWEHFWLNEGWTVFLERKIMSIVNGDGRYFDFAAIAGWADLTDSVALLPDEHTKLVPDLGDDDPDDAFSSVPYEKGFNLLYSLERLVGEGKFAGFVHAYFDRFKFSTVTTGGFVEYLEHHFKDDEVALAGIKAFDWETWLHEPGMPELPNFDRTLSGECERLADAWITADDDGTSAKGGLPELDISNWPSKLKTCFLDSLLEKCTERKRPLSLSTVAGIKETYTFHRSRNSEILFRFCILAVESGDVSILPVVVRFITTQGRMKFVRPLYRSLFQSAMGKELAVSTFIENRDFYHPIAAKMIATDLDEGTKKAQGSGRGGTELKIFLKKPLVVGGILALSAAISIALIRGKRR